MKVLKALGRIVLVVLVILGAAWIYLAQPSFKSSPASSVAVSSNALETHVRKLAIDFSPRSAFHIGNMNRTADYIKEEFQIIGKGEVIEQWFQVGAYRYRNVSLLMGDPKADRIVIGAHYDGFGPHQAADDNASGVAGMLELARLIAAKPIQTAIEFVGYPLEEPPHFGTNQMGSWKHVDQLRERGVKCRFMVSLEMIGYFSDQPGSQKYPIRMMHLFYPEKGNYITVVGNTSNRSLIKSFKCSMKGATPLPVYSLCGPTKIPGVDFSDHRNYWESGIPAIMITDTAFYRNFAYHTPGDTADRLDYKRMAMVVAGVYEALQDY